MTSARSTTAPNDPKPFFPCEPVDAGFFDRASARFVTTVDLDATPAKVFAILDDERSWPAWVTPGIRKVTWTTPRPHAVGTTRTVEMTGGMSVYETFFVWDDGKELAFHLTGATQEVWSRFAERYVVSAIGEGKTRLTWTLAYEPVGVFGRIQPLVKPVMGWVLASYLKRLANYVKNAA